MTSLDDLANHFKKSQETRSVEGLPKDVEGEIAALTLKYIEDLEKMVEILSDELEGYIDAEYKDLLNYPLNVRRKERDMQIVNEARELLKKG